MSIYRTIDGVKPGGIGFEQVERVKPAPAPAAPAKPAAEAQKTDEWKDKRKAAPVEKLMPTTLEWAAALPPQLLPRALLEKYPRVANLAAACWKEPASFHKCMADLVVVTDRRGKRQGFPADVLAELVNLQTFNYLKRHAPTLARQRAVEAGIIDPKDPTT